MDSIHILVQLKVAFSTIANILAEGGRILQPVLKKLLITGFLGALTTFSSFSLETVKAGRAGLTLQPLGNILVNNLGSLALTFIGLWLGGLK